MASNATDKYIQYYASNWQHTENISYSMVVPYIKDHGDLGFSAQNYCIKTGLCNSLAGIAKPKMSSD